MRLSKPRLIGIAIGAVIFGAIILLDILQGSDSGSEPGSVQEQAPHSLPAH